MKSLDRLPIRVRVPFFALSLMSGAMLAQEGSTSMAYMQHMNASMTEMDGAMKAAPMNGNVDHDFATMMIPHHTGAIDMAKAELLYGKDPTMRRLAQEIVIDQRSEIDVTNLWLAKQSNVRHGNCRSGSDTAYDVHGGQRFTVELDFSKISAPANSLRASCILGVRRLHLQQRIRQRNKYH